MLTSLILSSWLGFATINKKDENKDVDLTSGYIELTEEQQKSLSPFGILATNKYPPISGHCDKHGDLTDFDKLSIYGEIYCLKCVHDYLKTILRSIE